MLKTHLKIDKTFSGEVVELSNGFAVVKLKTTSKMVADEYGLIHGGFTFSAADFAAMAAVNDPNVVLVAAKVNFLAPVVVGESIEFRAKVTKKDGKRGSVSVIGIVGTKEVFRGEFDTYSPATHILQS